MADKDDEHQQGEGDSNQGKAEQKCGGCECKVVKAGDLRKHVKKKHSDKNHKHQQSEGDSHQCKCVKVGDMRKHTDISGVFKNPD